MPNPATGTHAAAAAAAAAAVAAEGIPLEPQWPLQLTLATSATK